MPVVERLAGALSAGERPRWPEIVGERLGSLFRAQAEALVQGAGNPTEFVSALEARIALLEELLAAPGNAPARIAGDTAAACAFLDALRAGPRVRALATLRERLPLLAALAHPASRAAAIEHEGGGSGQPLLDHLAVRVLGRKLNGLERGDLDVFQRGGGLSPARFDTEHRRLCRLRDAGLLPAARVALLHFDFAKGGTARQRRRWGRLPGVDLGIHNEAAAAIMAAEGIPSGMLRFPAEGPVVRAVVESHGLTGQIVRGETPLSALASFVRFGRGAGLEDFAAALAVSPAEARTLLFDVLHLVNLCDTAGVREGLLDDRLAGELEDTLQAARQVPGRQPVRELRDSERDRWTGSVPGAPAAEVARRRLADRLGRLRVSRWSDGEPPELVREQLDALGEDAILRLEALLDRCFFWYAESGSAALTPAAQLRLLLTGVQLAAGRAEDLGADHFHVNLLPLVAQIGGAADERRTYRIRILETLLAACPVEAILEGAAPQGALGRVAGTLGGLPAVAVSFEETEEATALLTLLAIYERKSVPAFHATLKSLTDLYGLRKDEFDRVANEAAYLQHMNRSRDDKARMLDYVRPGRIVEVGPGGGVVLDLLAGRFPESEVVGVDASLMAVESLRERQARTGARWSIVHGDAFHLPEIVPASSLDTVVFCSVLHEIYSYVEWPEAGGPRFQLDSVRALLQAAWRALGPGGRLLIRDGVMPDRTEPDRRLEFLTDDGMATFELFVREFQGRPIHFEPTGPRTVELPASDAMEFLYTFVWGPESFPYEVREQYGVLPYDEYRDRIAAWLAEVAPVRILPLDPADRSYLQPGYARRLSELVRLMDLAGREVPLPDSNALWVFERGAEE
ncbi:MAG TPA: methyltransferase domain-containing protein [Gemmatimonadota bacterium]|nr:methyltransferase domain-containing protein [Gemmatimonadota bacterium]